MFGLIHSALREMVRPEAGESMIPLVTMLLSFTI